MTSSRYAMATSGRMFLKATSMTLWKKPAEPAQPCGRRKKARDPSPSTSKAVLCTSSGATFNWKYPDLRSNEANQELFPWEAMESTIESNVGIGYVEPSVVDAYTFL
jgi:hypothetical protein